MKSFLFTLVIVGGVVFGRTIFADDIPKEGRLVDIEAKSLFVPVGFDDNDEIVAVLDGYLPDTCFKIAPAVVTRDLEHHRIIVEQQAREFPGECFDMVVPFTSIVKLGVLPGGEFSVVTNRGKTPEKLSIKRASSSAPDDYLYAPIDSAAVEETTPGHFTAVLKGRLSSPCAVFEKVLVFDHGKTIEVLPVIKMLAEAESGMKCDARQVNFTQRVNLPQSGPGRHLLHVRSLDGQSINVVFDGMPI